MKESKLYLLFLRRYFLIYTVFLMLFIGIALWFATTQPDSHKYTAFFELKSYLNEVERKERITDEIVTHLRSKNIQNSFNTKGSEKLTVFKPGPFAIQLEVEDLDKSNGEKFISIVESYTLENFELDKKGVTTYELVAVNYWRYIIMGILGGIFTGVAFSLIKEYFRLF